MRMQLLIKHIPHVMTACTSRLNMFRQHFLSRGRKISMVIFIWRAITCVIGQRFFTNTIRRPV